MYGRAGYVEISIQGFLRGTFKEVFPDYCMTYLEEP